MIDTRIRHITSRAVPIRGDDIDTDRIIPARFLRCVTFEGLGEQAFRDERFDEQGRPKTHPFNAPHYHDAALLVVNRHFGWGSSREHAPQALARWGIRAIVGISFADIFAGNCAAIGLPVLTASEKDVQNLQGLIEENPFFEVTVDLESLRCEVRHAPAGSDSAHQGDPRQIAEPQGSTHPGSVHQPERLPPVLVFPLGMNESHRQKFLAGTWDTLATLFRQEQAIEVVARRLPYLQGFSL